MIILDTNVISEPMKLNSNKAVLEWLDRQEANTLYLTSISLAELLVGIKTLPDGKRKDGLADALGNLMSTLFEGRILSFDSDAAISYASIIANAKAKGRTIGVADGQIAAIAATHSFAVASRDSAPFTAAGVPIINPWNKDN